MPASDGPPAPAGRVLAIFGPTAVGKTEVAIAVAEQLRATGEDPVAVSADALQVYMGLGRLTGAATDAEQELLEHRLLGFAPITEPFSVGDYMPLAHAEIDAALASGRLPIVVGGTGLYMRAALANLSLVKQPVGSEASELWSTETRHPTVLIGLTMDRAELYRRIDDRVDRIVAAGALEEVHAGEAAGAGRTARKALGYSELLSGDIDSMKRRSRNYAKRQLTWMRKMPGIEIVDLAQSTPAEAATQIVRALSVAQS